MLGAARMRRESLISIRWKAALSDITPAFFIPPASPDPAYSSSSLRRAVALAPSPGTAGGSALIAAACAGQCPLGFSAAP